MNILIVDDSKTIHSFVRACLRSVKCRLTSTFDGQEAIAELQKLGPGEFDVLLLDWEMPKLTGPETFAELRRLGFKMPVIMMTSRNKVEDIQQMVTAGVSEYVMKPFTSDILIEKLTVVLGSKVKTNAA